MFGSERLVSVVELALDGAQKLVDVKRLQWQAGDSITSEDWDTANAYGKDSVRVGLNAQSLGGGRRASGLAQQQQKLLDCHNRRCDKVTVMLEPMEIRTFRVELVRSASALQVEEQR